MKYLITIIGILLLVSACAPETPGITVNPTIDGISKFSSAEELGEYLKQSQEGINYLGGGMRTMVMEESMDSAVPMMAKASANEFSTTNVQVQGVDEADFVKNDNKFIYVISGDKLVIVDAYPADDMEILSETEIKGTPTNLFLNEDRLIVFTQDYEKVFGIAPYDFVPRPRNTQVTHAIVYDISNKEKPKELYDYSIKGRYFQARMIGDYVYLVTQEGVYYHSLYVDMPIVKEGSRTLIKPDVYYFDNPDSNYNFHTVVSLEITGDENDVTAQSFMLGYSNTLYMSEDNMYITYQKNLPWRYYETQNEDRFYEVVVPILPVRNQIEAINTGDSAEKWSEVQEILEEMYNSMDEDDKEDLLEEIQDAVGEYEMKLESDRRKTVIQRLSIDNGKVKYEASGEVPGYLLNQFSMDEEDGNLRVATNVRLWTRRESTTFNNVYVLDEALDIIGKLEGLAEGESIYSTRFMGDKLYMVTFKRVDPLFVIDLSDPTEPEVLGELKIPGYSDYLHPYGEDYIIGVGKETEENRWGGVSTGGVKIALFDVSDVENPELIDKYKIGEAGSDSEALRDHKAFFLYGDTLVIPVRRVDGNRYYEDGYWQRDTWQGAYVFSVSEEGFDKKGKITHQEGNSNEYYWRSPYEVRRTILLDESLYTISDELIKVNNLDDLDEIAKIALPGKSISGNKIPMPVMEREVAVGNLKI